jgi:nucleotide-binding universal stress UspA family protein
VFPERITAATDGSPDARLALRLAGHLAGRHHARMTIVSVDPSPGQQQEIASEVVELAAEFGVLPTVLRESGDPADGILSAAADASLIVVGSRGLSGLRALGSVSERVASRARSSVLVARHA